MQITIVPHCGPAMAARGPAVVAVEGGGGGQSLTNDWQQLGKSVNQLPKVLSAPIPTRK